MKKDIQFNLTKEMTDKLLKYNNLKKEMVENCSNYSKEELEEKEKELNNYRNEFINLFRLNNKEEIEDYLNN